MKLSLEKIILGTVIAFLVLYFACTKFIPEFYYQEGRNFRDGSKEQYENFRKANLYFMTFKSSYYPGTEKLMQNSPYKGGIYRESRLPPLPGHPDY
tara:strand:+ start:455 stop:742 length:288 start_codon:yes stop_codon:yes gene_type:complete